MIGGFYLIWMLVFVVIFGFCDIVKFEILLGVVIINENKSLLIMKKRMFICI